jgi:hypothetical protein
VVLVPKKKNKKQKGHERGINYPGGLKRRIPHGDTKCLLGMVIVIDLDLTYKFLEYGSLFVRCVRFEQPNKSDLLPSTTRARARFTPDIFPLSKLPTPQDCQPHPLVLSLAASTMADKKF